MPSDSTPRSLPFSIFLPPGRVDLCRATGTRSPTWTFQAPVTICTGCSRPASTWQIHMWSESGCRSMDSTLPTTTLEISSPRSWVSSTLEPDRVIASANSLSEASTWTNSSSHLRDKFIYENSLVILVLPRTDSGCRGGYYPPARLKFGNRRAADSRPYGSEAAPQNCSKNRTSFSKISRRSAILKRRMAVRSRPMPKAQPE